MNIYFLDHLLTFCHEMSGNLFAGILLFTAVTKLALLPLSLWCQWNSIIMVRLLPQINELKVKFFGNGEMLADAERKLFKEAHYHPFLSLVPLAVQILILLFLLTAIERNAAGSGFAAMIPYRDGGWSWVMPPAAGLSALLFGWSQNYLNPLQKEQEPLSQLVTNLISISISAIFGIFVSTGVCFYWAASNLLSIIVQLLCNLIIPPGKFVDYRRLRKSSVIYRRLKRSCSKKLTPEQRKREKADQKRFFSVANKHIVFYSESGGFYKYFEQLINYLLKHSNCTIHYVTSDPNDRIFEISRREPRIKAYFQGPVRLICLFMRMDADMVIMTTPDLENLHLKRSYVRKDIEYIYLDHAITSVHMTYREHAFDHFDTILCVCQAQADELRKMEELYGTKKKTLVDCGYGLLDTLMQRYAAEKRSAGPEKRILLAPSWQEGNILDGIYQKILPVLAAEGHFITVRPHPEYLKRFPYKWAKVKAFFQSRNWKNVVLEEDFSSNATIFNSDLVITDWSGIAYEFAFAVLRPVIFINTPMKVINPNYEKLNMTPINITMRSDVGSAVDISELDQIGQIVKDVFADSGSYKKKIMEARDKYVFNVGTSGRAAGMYILNRLVEKQKNKAVARG